ncbi:MAG: glycosyltransferase family 4 protein [Bacteroidales bacterium]
MKPIKILYCLPSLHLAGGMEKALSIKANYFAEKLGYQVTIVLTDGAGKKPFFRLSNLIEVINLNLNFEKIRKYPFLIKAPLYSIKQLKFRHRLNKLLMGKRPDITISMLRREINFLTKIKDGSKKIGEMQFNKSNFRDLGTKGKSRGIKGLLAKTWMGQLVKNLKKVDTFVVLSYEDMEKWTELNNLKVISNPIEKIPDKISDCSSKQVLAAGRIVQQKGFDMLLLSWAIVSAKHPDWVLHIYGEGNKQPLLDIIKQNQLTETCFLHDAVPDLSEPMLNSSIFAFSSRFEGFSLVLTEAMSYGLPPVAFACPCGPKDLIKNNLDGILVTPENIVELANKLCYLIENKDIRIEMGKEAREKAKKYTLDTIAIEWDTLFKELLNRDQ